MDIDREATKRSLIEAMNETSFGTLRQERREALALASAESVEGLLLDISRCPVAASCFHGNTESSCRRIVASQRVPISEFQLPEPWSGDLKRASILFLASNPSIDPAEQYPDSSWLDAEVVDFFQNRFGGGKQEWIKDGTHTLLKTGVHVTTGTKFFQSVRSRASELLKREAVPGRDYALTEVVHCKSVAEEGVSDAMMTCNYRYLDRVLSLSGARVIVVLGAVARESLTYALNVPGFAVNSTYGPTTIGGRERIFAFLPHPNARSSRTFKSWPDQGEAVRSFLRLS